MQPEPLIVPNLPFSLYLMAPQMNRGALWSLRDVDRYLYYRSHKRQPTESLDFGRAAHRMLLEPNTFDDRYAVMPEYNLRTKKGKADKAEFISQNQDRRVIKKSDHEALVNMREAIDSIHKGCIKEYILKANKELSAFFTWADIEWKVRWDGIIPNEKIILEYKTAVSCRREPFIYASRKYGYHLQRAFYEKAAEVCYGGEGEWSTVYIVQEKKPPFFLKAYYANSNEELMQEGDELLIDLLAKYQALVSCDFKENGRIITDRIEDL